MESYTGVVLVTAIVPTVGHRFLVEFAKNFMAPGGRVHLIISGLPKEPTTTTERSCAFYDMSRVIIHHHYDADAPQYPESDSEWNYWVNTIQKFIGKRIDYIFASEPYGQRLANGIGCRFIPVDIDREVISVKGTKVRKGIFNYGGLIAPRFRQELQSEIVLFGAESVGKTTLARELQWEGYGDFRPEWARPYLEFVGRELTAEKMLIITRGQAALERKESSSWDVLSIFDTDLLTTLGYYRILGWEPPVSLLNDINIIRTVPRHYFVLDTDIPFKPDPLRYGGDKRESTTEFWISILKEFNRPYTVISGNNRLADIKWAIHGLRAGRLGCTYQDIINYERD